MLPQLPQEVRDLGITVRKGSTDILLIVHMFADRSVDRKYIANYASLQVRERLLRTPGVGDDPGAAPRLRDARLDRSRARRRRDLTVQEIVAALRNNNLQVAGGAVGAPPFNDNPARTSSQSRAGPPRRRRGVRQAIIKRDAEGRVTRIGDVARVELGAQNYAIKRTRASSPPCRSREPGAEHQCARDRDNIRATMEELKKQFPPGVAYEIIFNPAPFTREAVDAVQHTLLEAMILAVIVVILFLQRWRTAMIPLLAIPVSLIGTLPVMSAFGFSLNNLSMFGLVLSIGIVVDDAIVVVENAERHLRAGMAPREAAHLTMDEVGGALIGIALVLVAVFVPTAFMGGIAGQFYKQFALTIASATVISLIVSLTLSPALAAMILKPHERRAREAVGAARCTRSASAPTLARGARRRLRRLARHVRCGARCCCWCSTSACSCSRAGACSTRRAASSPRRTRPCRSRHDAAGHEPRAHGRRRAAGGPDRARARRACRPRPSTRGMDGITFSHCDELRARCGRSSSRSRSACREA